MFSHRSSPKRAASLAILLMVISQLGETIYLPALPAMAVTLNTDPAYVQMILAFFLIAFGTSLFIYGPLSDYYGRRPIILGSSILFVGGAFAAALSPNIVMLLGSVIVLGFGFGTGGLMGRTLLRDLFSGVALQKAAAWMGIAAVISPIIAPIIGAHFLEWWGWQANFVFIGCTGIFITVLMYFFLEETNTFIGQMPLNAKKIIKSYGAVFNHPQFLGNIMILSIITAVIMAYEVAAPFVLQEDLGLTPVTYAQVAIIPIVGFLVGSYLAERLSAACSTEQLVRLGLLVSLLSGLIMLCCGYIGFFTVASIVAPMTLYLIGCGLIYPAATAGGLMPFAAMAGIAGALMGAIQNITAGIATVVFAILDYHDALPLAWALTIGSALSIVCYYRYLQKSVTH